MRKEITRTITATSIKSANVRIINGKANLEDNHPIVVNGTITPEKALKEVRKVYGENASVTEINEVSNVYEISVEDFIKYGKVVEDPKAEKQLEIIAE